jgi:hypothetical protein
VTKSKKKKVNENLPELNGAHLIAHPRFVGYQRARHRFSGVVQTTFLLLMTHSIPQTQLIVFRSTKQRKSIKKRKIKTRSFPCEVAGETVTEG